MSRYAWTTKGRNKAAIELAERIEAWGKRLELLGVAHIRIDAVSVVDDLPGDSDADAAVTQSTDYDHCRFWFTNSFLESCTESELDQTILHEWIHVAMKDHDRAVALVERWMPPATYEQFTDVIEREREKLVDRLANLLYYAFTGERATFSI